MSRIENGEEYLNGEEVMDFWSASKNLFYRGIQPRLQAYHFDGKKRPHYYKKSEVLALRSGKPAIRKEPITISGILSDWTLYLRAQGYQADTTILPIETTALPEEISTAFHIPSGRQFAQHTRKTLANGVPICMWSTYYSLGLVGSEILAEMKQDPRLDVVKRIKEVHGIIVGWERNRYTARNATLEEQEALQLLTNEPVLILQRECWTRDKQILTHISHMTLLSSWFAIEHETAVDPGIWSAQKEIEI